METSMINTLRRDLQDADREIRRLRAVNSGLRVLNDNLLEQVESQRQRLRTQMGEKYPEGDEPLHDDGGTD